MTGVEEEPIALLDQSNASSIANTIGPIKCKLSLPPNLGQLIASSTLETSIKLPNLNCLNIFLTDMTDY
jgi:hypothetical protein